MADSRTLDQKRFAGWVQIVLGGFAIVLCGGCTLAFWTAELTGLGIPLADDLTPYELIAFVIGVLPTVAGAYLVWRGIRDLRAAKTPPNSRE